MPLFFWKKDLIKHINSSAFALTEPIQFHDFCYFFVLSSYDKGTLCREKRYVCYIKIGCENETEFWSDLGQMGLMLPAATKIKPLLTLM